MTRICHDQKEPYGPEPKCIVRVRLRSLCELQLEGFLAEGGSIAKKKLTMSNRSSKQSKFEIRADIDGE
jgi:hypothetical protein